METKRCSRCGEHLALEMFHRNKRTKSGYSAYCKKCAAERRCRKYTPKEEWAEGYRACTKCDEIKPLTDFNKAKNGRFGHASVCRSCHSTAKPKPQPREGYLFCYKCGEEKPATPEYFRRSSKDKNGITPLCRVCTRKAAKERYHRLISEDPDFNKKRYQKDRAYHRRQNRIYYLANREVLNRKGREYREKNSSLYREQNRRYYQKNRETIIKRVRQWRQDNPERYQEYNRQWAEDNPETYEAMVQAGWARRRARKQNLPDEFTAEDWLYCLDYWEHQCAVCGDDKKFHADHWIPLSNDDCPGTVVDNMIVLCEHCNETKHAIKAERWLRERFGEEMALEILAKVETYFVHVRERNSDE